MPTVPIVAGAAGTAAVAAYLNAKYHIGNDITKVRGLTPTATDEAWLGSRVMQKRLLVYHRLQDQAKAQSNHPFLIFEGREYSYGEFFDRVVRTANWLLEMGVKQGEVVAIDGANSPEHIMLWLGLDAIGAAFSFINCHLTGPSLVHCIKLCDSRFLFAEREAEANVEPCRSDLESNGVKITYYDPAFMSSLENRTPIPTHLGGAVQLEDLRGLIYTSGTTGLPKGVLMSTGRELLVGYMAAKYLELTPKDRMYTCMPLYHGAAHGLCMTPVINSGATVVLGRKFSHKTFWPEVVASKANIIQYVGELCRYLVNGPPSKLDRAHRVQMAWGNGMRPDVWEPFRERFGIPIINELYAATDGLGSSFNKNYGPFGRHAIGIRGAIWNWKFGNNEVRVKMDVDTEEIMRDKNGFAIRVATNEPGQVLHKLDPALLNSAPGYYKNDKATVGRRITDVFQKGDLWFKSGDMMRQDADGRVYFVDRLGDTFRWKSENVSTNEVSDVLGQFPQIAEVNVYGVAVPRHDGRAGAACFVMADGISEASLDLKELAGHVQKALPRYAQPVFLRLSESLEYTGTLKMQKGRLKREGIEVDLVGGDKLFWLPPGKDTYVPFEKEDLEALKDGRIKLT